MKGQQKSGSLLICKPSHNQVNNRHTQLEKLLDDSNINKSTNSQFQNYLFYLHQKYQSLKEGLLADYIPELKKANPEWFGISIVTTDGQIYQIGDYQQTFTIQSISKPFVYGMALENYGREVVLNKVGVEPTGQAFNSIDLDQKNNRPYNPMVNAGAIATTNLLTVEGASERLEQILKMFSRYTGREHNVDWSVFLSEKATGSKNKALAYLMHNSGMISDNIEETLDLYFQQCSISVSCHDLAMMGATLANKGVNPITGEQALNKYYVQDVLSVMHSCGMYDFAGEWAYRVGLPAKSGVSGGLVMAIPGKCGIGIFSPLLDAKGNSVRAIKVCEQLTRDLGLHLYNAVEPIRNFAF
ncbi:glutaminase A [Nostoc sp. LEGE 12447]|uniref:glutaminase A n=1 Tax=Nostoc sp. LEGE 12447 TaxID=1828640 RepID=UPI001883CA2A|nr:glutaminase A [Nostoc sp. LEGE 12447]MBE9002071.1 glutaminase A [Nostoc sp. LEGE 12447]